MLGVRLKIIDFLNESNSEQAFPIKIIKTFDH